MSVPVDYTNIESTLGWMFHSVDVDLFGSTGIMLLFLILIIFVLLMFFNANRFTTIGFMATLLIALGFFGYSIVGWIAPVGAILAGLVLGIIFIKIFQL
jgi:hypothetical protein